MSKSSAHPAGAAAMIHVEGLTKRYGAFTAVSELSLQVAAGEVLGFIGPNGAGKTTTIKVLVGLARPTEGRAMIDGIDCTREAVRVRSRVGYMPDVFGAYDRMRVREYLDFFGAAYRLPRQLRRARIEQVMDLTGSAYMRDLYVESLSHGMKQRVAVARTLLHDPKVLILDEPANGLDPAARIEMRQLLLRLAEMGKTLIVTSHILPELARICHRVAIITQGRLRALGTLEEIMRQVRQRRLFEVQLVKPAHAPIVAQALRKMVPWPESVQVSQTEAMVRFEADGDDAAMHQMLKNLTERGAPIVQFREVMMDLEDAFLSVTREGEKGLGSGV